MTMQKVIYGETQKHHKEKKKKKNKEKLQRLTVANKNVPVKQCVQCHSLQTPQWRDGPLGKKIYCNACGVKFKRKCSNNQTYQSSDFYQSEYRSVIPDMNVKEEYFEKDNYETYVDLNLYNKYKIQDNLYKSAYINELQNAPKKQAQNLYTSQQFEQSHLQQSYIVYRKSEPYFKNLDINQGSQMLQYPQESRDNQYEKKQYNTVQSKGNAANNYVMQETQLDLSTCPQYEGVECNQNNDNESPPDINQGVENYSNNNTDIVEPNNEHNLMQLQEQDLLQPKQTKHQQVEATDPHLKNMQLIQHSSEALQDLLFGLQSSIQGISKGFNLEDQQLSDISCDTQLDNIADLNLGLLQEPRSATNQKIYKLQQLMDQHLFLLQLSCI